MNVWHHYHLVLLIAAAFVSVFLPVSCSHVVIESEEYQMTNINPKCERIRVEMCSDIQYNMTIYPNLLKHTKQEEAEADIKQYEMLVKVQCSSDFKFFLCTLFTPVCTILNEPIPPCRQLCLSAKKGCDELMRRFGYQWPEIFDCDKMPMDADEAMCVGYGEAPTTSPPSQQGNRTMLECPHPIKALSTTRHKLLIANQTLDYCSLPCQNDGLLPTFFSTHIRHYMRLWTGAWAVTCSVCCIFTIITFLIDLERFEFPERAIFYMAICHLIVSGIYMIGLVAEDGISCAVRSPTKQLLVSQGNENVWCSAMAFAHFFFLFAGALWWLILCFSWFLVTTLKWGEAPVGQVFSSYFNAFAWLLPIVGIIVLLATGGIDGDVFTGVCSVGNLQPKLFFHFAILPQIVLIGIGLILFTCGFISVLRIRQYIKVNRFISNNKFEQMEASEKLSKLLLRISSFSLLYILPAAIGAYCSYYQAENMEYWLTNWYSTRCLHAHRASFGFTQPREHCPIANEANMNNQPQAVYFFLKYIPNFSVGIACAIWTLNGKTVTSYADFFARLFFRQNGHHRGRPTRIPTRVH